MKNNSFKTKIVISLLLPFLFVTSCAKGGSSSSESGGHVEKTFKEIDSRLVENGESEYKVVLPSAPTSEERLAANELVEFVNRATSVELEVVSENTIDTNFNGKYVSLGNTEFVTLAGIVLTKDELGESGYYLKTVNNCIIISGFQATNYYGTLYGVYDFLKYTIGLEIYASDEIFYNTSSTVKLYQFDEIYRPTFDLRAIEYRALNADLTYQRRLRYMNKGNYWCSFTHTLVTTYLPYSKYGATHPEYYGTTGGQQICYTNQGCLDALVDTVEAQLAKYPNTEYCMLGQEDNWSYCRCETCTAAIEKFGTLGGLELDFTNRVGKRVDQWLHNAYPGRKVTYVFFAYNSSLEAPVVKDSSGKISKFCKELEVYENTGVMIAPVGMDFGSGMYSDANIGTTQTMDNWSWLFEKRNSFVWTYCIQSRSNFFHLPNFGVQKEFYKYYEDIGAKFIYDQGCYQMNTPALQAMRTYISSKMMWDTSYDYYDLAYDFLRHYYGEAGENMIEYLDFLVAYYAYLRDTQSVNGRIFMMLDDAAYWPLSTVQSMLAIFDKALAAIEPLKNSDLQRYQDLYDRIQIERCSPLYMMCNFYLSSLSQSTKEEYLNTLSYYTQLFEIKGTQEGAFDVADKIATWRNA